ncbi:hypothetical protein B7463_g4734, partial [Scytalidium lignicola]
MIYYFATGLGVTAGTGFGLTLWSHRSYHASLPLRITLAAFGGGAVEGSIKWWSRHHRVHHRFTDTEHDPYSVQKGLFYAHMGWMLVRENSQKLSKVDISDLNGDFVVVWQHRHYLQVVLFMGLILPMAICGIGWQDWFGGFIYAGILRIFFLQQATFCVNSLAHWLGSQTFDDHHSPRDHLVTALITFGEGYHNFHHEFPSDYRNAIEWYQYDITKWMLWVLSKIGLADGLKKFPSNEIEKGRLQQLQKQLDIKQSCQKLDTTNSIMEWDEFQRRVHSERCNLLVVAGVMYDISNMLDDHPGGKDLLLSMIGMDATASFYGGVHRHSRDAHHILETHRVGVIRGGGEVESRKQH